MALEANEIIDLAMKVDPLSAQGKQLAIKARELVKSKGDLGMSPKLIKAVAANADANETKDNAPKTKEKFADGLFKTMMGKH